MYCDTMRATPLLRVIVKFTVENTVCMSLRLTAYGEFDCEVDYDSQEWSCSERCQTCWWGPAGNCAYGTRSEKVGSSHVTRNLGYPFR